METDPRRIVADFFDAWRSMDADKVASYFTEDAVYHNIPMDRIVGRDAIRATIKGWLDAMPSIDFRFKHVFVEGNVVLMERSDVVSTAQGLAELPIMAVIELEDGKIAAWREYFDLLQMQALSRAEPS